MSLSHCTISKHESAMSQSITRAPSVVPRAPGTRPASLPAPRRAAPKAQGLYQPENEHDACGVGFVAHIKGRKSHSIIQQGLKILENLDHRGAVGADELMGDGAMCLWIATCRCRRRCRPVSL
jgi:glutamate synthase (NADPH/NADH) large chain